MKFVGIIPILILYWKIETWAIRTTTQKHFQCGNACWDGGN